MRPSQILLAFSAATLAAGAIFSYRCPKDNGPYKVDIEVSHHKCKVHNIHYAGDKCSLDDKVKLQCGTHDVGYQIAHCKVDGVKTEVRAALQVFSGKCDVPRFKKADIECKLDGQTAPISCAG